MMAAETRDMKAGGFSLGSIIFACAIGLVISASFMPGYVKGAIFGYEFGAGNAKMPFRLPLVRPVALKRGDVVEVSYDVRLITGRLDINAYASPQLTTMIFNTNSSTLLTLRGDAAGKVSFRTPEDGFYIFNTSVGPADNSTHRCDNMFKELWNVLTRTRSACPGYTAQYSITFRGH